VARPDEPTVPGKRVQNVATVLGACIVIAGAFVTIVALQRSSSPTNAPEDAAQATPMAMSASPTLEESAAPPVVEDEPPPVLPTTPTTVPTTPVPSHAAGRAPRKGTGTHAAPSAASSLPKVLGGRI
jgi:hypothetical protein